MREVDAVWHRRESSCRVSPRIVDASQRAYVELISTTVLEGFWAITGQRWLPGRPSVDTAANNKVYHAAVAAGLGFVLPPTLMTNSPEAFVDFWNDAPGEMVSKSPSYRDLFRDGERCMLYTHLVERRDVFRADSVQYAPVIFQHYVRKRVELRVTVVGTQVHAAEIDSQASRSTRHDWRHYDDPNVRYQVHVLPDEMQLRCVRLVQTLGLAYSAIDLVLTPEGEYVFLEINSNGQWGWIEQMTGLPIARAIADWLIGDAPARKDARD
jgi:glutathione synthase/RimK-type ligase-like ATP-grasp enzyme